MRRITLLAIALLMMASLVSSAQRPGLILEDESCGGVNRALTAEIDTPAQGHKSAASATATMMAPGASLRKEIPSCLSIMTTKSQDAPLVRFEAPVWGSKPYILFLPAMT